MTSSTSTSPVVDAQSPIAQPRDSPPVSPPPAPELRRLTSATALAPQRLSPRNSVHLGNVRLGSRSPATSIPSSPTSVHSSSSAIFERDVEPLPSLALTPPAAGPSLAHAPSNPHLTARAKATEALEQAVPSVLDSAAAVLTSSAPEDREALEHVSVVAPASSVAANLFGPSSPLRSRGGTPQRSRSSSPMNRFSGIGAQLEQSLLLHLPSNTGPASPPAATSGSPPVRPAINTERTVTQVPRSVSVSSAGGTPTSTYFTTSAGSTHSSPTTTTAATAPTLPTPTPGSTFASAGGFQAGSPTGSMHLPSPPSPSMSASAKRLSFMSYSDLLTSTPASTLPLSHLTTTAGSEPPAHIPSVLGLAGAGGLGSGSTSPVASTHAHALFGDSSAASSVRALGTHASAGHAHGFPGVTAGHAARRERESVLLGAGDDGGGEWEREGLGMGLEERLETLMTPPREGVVGHA